MKLKKISIPRKETHKFVIERYSTGFSGDLTASQIGIKLGRLRADRERVDYDDSVNLKLKPTASFHLMNACAVITLVNSLPQHQFLLVLVSIDIL
jgi:hypothetical protein